MKKKKQTPGIDRRGALALIGGAVATVVVGCAREPDGSTSGGSSASASGTSGSSLSGSSGSSGGSSSGSTGSANACAATPEGEVGPYFTDDSAAGFERTDLTSNIDGTNVQAGIPLSLVIYVVDSETNCAPLVGVQVDIWHCTAAGVYSNEASENTLTETYLRGYQVTDAHGMVTFSTILPGWYSGRTTHIHLRLRSSYDEASGTADGTNTTQLFFPQSLLNTLETTVAAYSSEGVNPTTNAIDRVYSTQVDGANQLNLAGNMTSGFSASITIGLPIGNASASTPNEDGGVTLGGPMGDGGMGSRPRPGDGGMGIPGLPDGGMPNP